MSSGVKNAFKNKDLQRTVKDSAEECASFEGNCCLDRLARVVRTRSRSGQAAQIAVDFAPSSNRRRSDRRYAGQPAMCPDDEDRVDKQAGDDGDGVVGRPR